MLLLALASASPAAVTAELEAFRASYSARYGALPFSAGAVRELRREGDHWLFSSELDAGVVSLRQETELTAGEKVRPLHYRYRQRGLAGRRDRLITFDYAAGQVRRSGDKHRQHPLTGPSWDPLGWQLALRQDLLGDHPRPAASYSYRVSDGGGYESYDFVNAGREPLTVPAGTFAALKLERRHEADDKSATTLWLAPALDYLLLRLELVDDSGRQLSVTLTEPPAGRGAETGP